MLKYILVCVCICVLAPAKDVFAQKKPIKPIAKPIKVIAKLPTTPQDKPKPFVVQPVKKPQRIQPPTKLFGDLAKADSVFSIDLSDKKLAFLPKEIGLLKNLKKLDLYQNSLTTLPNEVSELQNLEEINLGANKKLNLRDACQKLAKLPKLRKIRLNNNNFTVLPAEIGLLANLQVLDLQQNALTNLPAEIGNLRNLRELYLPANKFLKLSDGLLRLDSLLLLDMYGNQMRTLPNDIVLMKSLKVLNISHNNLDSLPSSFSNMKNISEIYSFEYYLYTFNLKNKDNLLEPIMFLNEESLHRQIGFNARMNEVHPYPFLLIQAASKVFELSQSYGYIKNKIIDFEKYLLSHPSYMDHVIFKNEEINNNISVQTLVESHCQELGGVFKYVQSGSYEMKRDFLAEIIWGDSQLPLNIDSIWNPVEISAIKESFGLNILEDSQKIKLRRETGIKNISCFSIDMLKELCKDSIFLRKFFRKIIFYSFIEFILLKIWNSIKFYDWSSLPEFYS